MSKIRVVTIERQYCSGGSAIGKLAAQKLGIKCYDHELVDMAEEKVGVSKQEIAKLQESVLNPLKTPISLRTGADRKLTVNEKIFAAQAELITNIAKKEQCVIVGRCADHILKSTVPILSVYIYASQESRIQHATEEHGIDYDEVESVLKRYDKKRASFYNINTTKNWSSMQTYDICLNSSRLGYERCAEIIADLVRNSK